MIVIDALNIKGGGCGVLLDYLIEELQKETSECLVLSKDSFQFENTINNNRTFKIGKFHSYAFNRAKILKEIIHEYNPKILLCFGHFPPPFKPKGSKVYTYFHNFFLLDHAQSNDQPIEKRCIHFLKKKYLKQYLNNSDVYFVQTPLIKQLFLATYSIAAHRVKVLPFYNELKINRQINGLKKHQPQSDTFIYPSSAAPHKNHINLIKAWEILASRNLFPTLKITVPKEKRAKRILAMIEDGLQQKINIKNLGTVPYETMLSHINDANYCIFPSLRETLGLPLIESAKMGKKILVSDLDYVKHIVTPSITFNPHAPISIADAVEYTLHSSGKNAKSLLKNDIVNLKEFLLKEF